MRQSLLERHSRGQVVIHHRDADPRALPNQYNNFNIRQAIDQSSTYKPRIT